MSFGFIPNLGIPELILILVIALIIFGPSKLPDIGKSLGKSIREFKNATSGNLDNNEASNNNDETEQKNNK